MLTSLVALENFSPDQEVTVTSDALGQSSADTLMGLKAGQTLTVKELLDGMLLPSGDDAASAIAGTRWARPFRRGDECAGGGTRSRRLAFLRYGRA